MQPSGGQTTVVALHDPGVLAEWHGAARLHEIRRFTETWEGDASLQLRRRDPAALAEYAMRARIHG